MGNQKEALMKNLEDIDKEEVAVIHSAFGDKPHVVAFVKVDKTLTDEQKCEQAFKLTNTIEQGWWNNEGVQYIWALNQLVGLQVLVIKCYYQMVQNIIVQ